MTGSEPVPSVDVVALSNLLREGLRDGAALIDVREPAEHAELRVPGVALVPLATLPDRVDELTTTGPLYVICASGGRSARAAAWLRERGIDAVNVEGGTRGWAEAGLPTESGPT